MPGESGPAYEAFLAYRDMGSRRTFVGAARVVGKRESLLRRWAARHQWRERVWQWDLQQARQDATVVRQHRAAVLSERLDDLNRMGLVCLGFFRNLVRRDPATGEVSFDDRFTPHVALRFLELTLKAQGAFHQPTAEDKPDEQPAADLFGLADAELTELIELARERADQHDQRKEDDNGSQRTERKQGEEQDEAAPE
jgi:hypothetical protein